MRMGKGWAFHAAHWANAMVLLDRTREAVALLRAAHDEFPEELDLQLALARAHAMNNEPDLARELYEALLATDIDPAGRASIERELAEL